MAVAATSEATAPEPPRYGHRSLADLLPAVIATLRPDDRDPDDEVAPAAPGSVATELADLPPRVVVLVVDGLGAALLTTHATAAPTLSGAPGADLDAVFPTTTAASIASIGTGEPPATHGIVGYAWPVPGHDQPLNGLGWRIGRRAGGFDARAVVVPETLHPAPTALERATEADITTTAVLHPRLLDSGLTRAALRGGQRVAASGLVATLDRAVEEVSRPDGPALAYAHHPRVDWAAHVHGPATDEARDAIADVDRALTALAERLPADVAVLVTADHGMLDVPPEDVLELAEHPGLLDGVRVLAGEPRVRHVAVEPGVDVAEVAARWRATLGDRALVLRREQALPLFGPRPTPAARAAVGDLVVLARHGTLVHERVDPHGGRHRGQHGGLTDVERLVPLRRLTRTT